ncbi:hypothetical protein, partial [Pusillimonas sp. T2]|uniref:hypothetical protein n=1 Tax=Pusillimonas sp. T2 TaxID=1548123 RepID=UPI001C1FE843
CQSGAWKKQRVALESIEFALSDLSRMGPDGICTMGRNTLRKVILVDADGPRMLLATAYAALKPGSEVSSNSGLCITVNGMFCSADRAPYANGDGGSSSVTCMKHLDAAGQHTIEVIIPEYGPIVHAGGFIGLLPM